jgi:hypothetical protein
MLGIFSAQLLFGHFYSRCGQPKIGNSDLNVVQVLGYLRLNVPIVKTFSEI